MTEKEIKNRIKSIGDTVKITKAMQMLASTKIYQSEAKQKSATDYFREIEKSVLRLLDKNDKNNKLFSEGTGASSIVVVGAEKGLCGDYNHQIFKLADEVIDSFSERGKIYSVGFVAREYYRAKNIHTDTCFVSVFASPTPTDAGKMADELIKFYLANDLKEIRIIYTDQTENGWKATDERLLPFEWILTDESEQVPTLGENKDVQAILKEYLTAKIYRMLTTANNAVNYKRMMAMKQSTINGEEMVEDLTLQYNRTRQNKITNELNDSTSVLFGKKV